MANAPYLRPGADIFGHPKYLLKRQILTFLGAKLRVYDPAGTQVLFIHQKAFKIREDIRVYADESMAHEILSIRARQIIDWSAAYDVFDNTTGTKVGAFRRKGWSSLVRDTWKVLDINDVQIGEITEDNMTLALVRRFLSNLVPQGYDMMMTSGKVADYAQRFNPFVYNMDIDFSMDRVGSLDRRLGLAAAILLATIEGRQGGGGITDLIPG
jgi:uncharacterized protein YxjI